MSSIHQLTHFVLQLSQIEEPSKKGFAVNKQHLIKVRLISEQESNLWHKLRTARFVRKRDFQQASLPSMVVCLVGAARLGEPIFG